MLRFGLAATGSARSAMCMTRLSRLRTPPSAIASWCRCGCAGILHSFSRVSFSAGGSACLVYARQYYRLRAWDLFWQSADLSIYLGWYVSTRQSHCWGLKRSFNEQGLAGQIAAIWGQILPILHGIRYVASRRNALASHAQTHDALVVC